MKSASTAHVDRTPETQLHGLSSVLRRRNVLVDRPSQLTSVAFIGLLALALLIPVNLGMHVIHTSSAAQAAMETPELVSMIEDRNRAEAKRIMIGSLAILFSAMIATLLSTHRTAGAAVGLTRGIRRLRDGHYGSTITLRRGDRLRNVEHEVNELSRSLLARSEGLADALERNAEALDRMADTPEIRTVAIELRELAQQQRG